MNKTLKKINSLFLICFTLFGLIGVSNYYVNAQDNNPIYYEEEVKEENSLPTGITHKQILGYSQVTDASLISKDAKEAGLGSSTPIVMNKYYSQQINLLEIPYESQAKIVPWGVISKGSWNLATVKTMAENYEQQHPGWKVIAAVNGDFFDINGNGKYPYTPSGTMYVDENMYKINSGWGILGFNNSQNGPRLIGLSKKENIKFSSRPYLYIYDENNNVIKEIEVTKTNQEPNDNEIALYFSPYNSEHKIETVAVNNGYIVENAENTVAVSVNSFFGKGVISKVGSSDALTKNQFAIVSNNAEINTLLQQNVLIKVQYKNLNPELSQCDGMIGLHDKILVDGEGSYDNDGYGNDRLPRTLLGTKEDGSVVMLTIDGRQASKGFYGAAQEEYVAIAKNYGIVNGYQMDGGGSSTMIILDDGDFKVCNSPSDSGGVSARSDSDCILVVTKTAEITYDVSSTDSTVEISITSNKENLENIYVELNGIKNKVENNKVRFDNLQSNTEYDYEFYQLVNDEYQSIIYQGVVTTFKQIPEILKLYISYEKINNELRYVISCDLYDPDNALVNLSLTLDGNNYWINDGMFKVPNEKPNILCFGDWSLKFVYKLHSLESNVIIKLSNVEVVATNSLVLYDEQAQRVNNTIDSILSN